MADIIDVDKSYDPKSGKTLDEHRQEQFAQIEQPGWGGPTHKPQTATEEPAEQ